MILTDVYPPPSIGGAPQIAYYQAKAFKDIGWDVAVVCSLRIGIDSKPTVTDEEEIKGLLINGRFQTINDEIYVEFEAYDIHNWTQLIKREIFCPVQD